MAALQEARLQRLQGAPSSKARVARANVIDATGFTRPASAAGPGQRNASGSSENDAVFGELGS